MRRPQQEPKMRSYSNNSSQRGSAILLVLGILSMVMTIAIVFAMTTRNSMTISKAAAQNGKNDLLAESATSRVAGLLYYMGNGKTALTHHAIGPVAHVQNFMNRSRLTLNSDLQRKYRSGSSASADVYTEPDYLEVYYSAAGTGDPVLPEIQTAIESVKYGKLLAENTDFSTALKGMNFITAELNEKPHSDDAADLPDELFRYAFLMVNDTSKFDINQLVNYKNSGYVPAVGEDGKFVPRSQTTAPVVITDWKDPKNATGGGVANILPVLGYNNPASPQSSDASFVHVENGDDDEKNTLRYGLHPQELVVPRKLRGLFGDTQGVVSQTSPLPVIPSCDFLAASAYSDLNAGTLNTGDESFARYFMLYCTDSGAGDSETLHDGTEKANIQYPGFDQANTAFNDWETLSGEARTNAGGYDSVRGKVFASSKLSVLGNNPFGDKITDAVEANLIDFSDSDNLVTHNLRYNNQRVTFRTKVADAPAASFEPASGEDVVCGNEKVPAVSSLLIRANIAPDTDITITNKKKVYDYPDTTSKQGEVNVYTWDLTASKLPTPAFSLRVQLDNIYRDDLDAVKPKVKVIVKGRYCIYYIGRYDYTGMVPNGMAEPPQKTRYVYSQNCGGIGSMSTTCFGFISNDKGKIDDVVADTGNMVARDGDEGGLKDRNTVYFHWEGEGELDADVSALSRHDVSIDTPTKVETRREDGSPYTDFKTSVTNAPGNIGGMGMDIVIDEIVVLMADANDTSTDELIDFARYKPDRPSKVYDYAVPGTDGKKYLSANYERGSIDEGTAALPNPEIRNFLRASENGEETLTAWMSSVDPRCNHLTEGWRWRTKDPDDAGSSFNDDCFHAGSGTYPDRTADCFAPVANSDLPSYTAKVADDAVKTQQSFIDTYKADAGNMVDTEQLVWTDDAYTQTYSTAFIANKPLTSLWQIGAVHRGEPGRTVNLKKYGGKDTDHDYVSGDGWIMDYLKLSAVSPEEPVRGKFNPNCLNGNSFRYLLEGLPQAQNNGSGDPDPYLQYSLDAQLPAPGPDGAAVPANVTAAAVNWPAGMQFASLTAPADCTFVPVEMLYKFIPPENLTVGCDREQEKLYACTAGLLSTRYELFTVFTVSQNLKYISTDAFASRFNSGDVDTSPANAGKHPFLKNFASPEMVTLKNGKKCWYEMQGSQVRVLTILRDCWQNKITILRSQRYD